MRIRFGYLMAAGAVAAMASAPMAAAAPSSDTTSVTHPGQHAAAAAPGFGQSPALQTPEPVRNANESNWSISQKDHARFKLIWPGQSCGSQGAFGTDVLCQSPGNAQINDSLPMFGGGYGGGFGGGFLGGGFW